VLQEFFVTVTGKLRKRFSAEEALMRMDYFAQWPIYANDYSSIREAVELAGKAVISFWDALIVVAASWSGATILYTEDFNHGQKLLGVTVVNPFK
jgi:predicted nucleic acid-binding protein